ncbi:protein-L-isoaspartate(D-aspartate) O-methyltransferase [Flocculibacter collagenilyticus]|uniref:protein-L-isoaspartate(D-aspartate) O-methyltransferase n=1 Tax=Flocculibacter collagenilyticus TaxID=2744479 RepID=UPI0018F3C9AC|nr:protein-L-isoaspartate(D-aspartate) O-methyltransferase [Flocculibacter collagenilyticus]
MNNNSPRSPEQLAQLLEREGIKNRHVLRAIANTPRHIFLPQTLTHKAYENTALPIGQGQTLSQPYIVARMTELLLEDGPKKNVLEVGTGSGYQTAILAQLVEHVCSIERIQTLQFQAKRRLKQLDLYNISTKYGDGWQGWESKAPFDAIIVTAAPPTVPEALLQQLAEGGRLVIPVGADVQVLEVITREGNKFKSTQVESVRFVPLVPGELK